jgi:5-hydroxyisourate hydrolase
MSQLTTHILDTTKGQPASLVKVVLYQHIERSWIKIANGITNSDGRVANLLPDEEHLPFGIYKLNFDTKHYFDAQEIESFYPTVEIIFEIKTTQHYHVPLLLSPFGYSTYRGS